MKAKALTFIVVFSVGLGILVADGFSGSPAVEMDRRPVFGHAPADPSFQTEPGDAPAQPRTAIQPNVAESAWFAFHRHASHSASDAGRSFGLSELQVASGSKSIVWVLDPPSWYEPPLKVTPGGSRTLFLTLYNVGAAPLTFDVTDDHDCIQGSAGGTIPPADSAVVSLTVDGSGLCSGTFIDGNVILNTDEGGGTTDSLPVQAVVAEDYYECPNDPETVDTLDNGVLRLYANANCGQWIHDIGTFPDTTHQVFFRGGTIVATTSSNDTLVGRFMGSDWHAGAQDKLYMNLCDVDWEPDFWILYTKDIFMHDLEPPADYTWWWWEISKQIKVFTETAPEVYKHLVIKYVTVQRNDPPGWWPDQTPFSGYDHTYVGVAMDIDCPWDTLGVQSGRNLAGYDEENHIAYQVGWDWTGTHPEYNNYYCGIALANAGMPGEATGPFGSHNVRADQYLYPQDGWGWKDGELLELASTPGIHIQDMDSAVDRAQVFTAHKIEAGSDESAEASFTLVEAVAPNGLAQLQEYVDSARAIVAREAGHGIPVICGDANGDGAVNILDILAIIAYLNAGGTIPCPVQRADVNGGGSIGNDDVIFLVTYLFRSGPPPDCPGLGFSPYGPILHESEYDTMYIEPWPADTILEGEGPYFVRAPIYVTADVADFWDSISAFIVPLCYAPTYPGKYCSLSAWWNNTDLYPWPTANRSIFRHFIEGQDTLVHNRMMSLSQNLMGQEWDTRILDLDGTSHFWLALMATSSMDQNWWEGSRVLLATMTFKLEDSMEVCIDTCFWPPSNRLAWVSDSEGGGPPVSRVPRPGTGDPDSYEVCFGYAEPEPELDCNNSNSDPCLVACPLGDIPFRVYLKDTEGSPMANYSDVWLDFSNCTGIIPCTTETAWPIVYPDGPSDSNGVLTFYVHAGGCDEENQVEVLADCGLIANMLRPVRTVDPDGDLVVRANDWHGVDVDLCNDYNCNEEINYWDVDFFKEHMAHSCVRDSCLLLSQDLTVTPDTLLPVDSTHEVRLLIKNNNPEPCSLMYVTFHRAGFGQGTALIQFALRYLDRNLMPGDTVTAGADFIVPGPGSGYILTELHTDCCDHGLTAVFSFIERMCPPDSMVYVFPLFLSTAPDSIATISYIPTELGWYWFLYQTGDMPDSVAIVTPDTSILGVTGGVMLFFYDEYGNDLGSRICEVRITLNSGDVNADCVVSAGDIVYLINYLYRNDPPPNPYRAGDVNCDPDCLVNAGDVVYLINYLFRDGPPPVSSETCECEYKGWFPR